MANPVTIEDKTSTYAATVDSSGNLHVATSGSGSILVAFPTVTWTQTTVSLSATVSATLIAANANRKALRWMNAGTNPMTVVPGAGPAVAGTGMNYGPATGTGQQGGSETFIPGEVSTQQFTAISTLGTTVIVWEGV